MRQRIRYRLPWNPSPSANVVRQELVYNIGTNDPVVVSLKPHVAHYELAVMEGDEFAWFVRTFSQNGARSDSDIQSFTSADIFPPVSAELLPAEAIEIMSA